MARNNQCCDLNPDAEFLVESYSVQYWLEPCTADTLVEFITESFEVDVYSMEIRPDDL